MKARLPLAPQRASVRVAATSGPARQRMPVDRALVCVLDEAAPGPALRFACAVLERVRARGQATAVLSSHAIDAGAAQRLSTQGVALSVLAESALPDAALRVLAGLPDDATVVALGAAFAVQFEALLTLRIGAGPGLARVSSCDLDFAYDDGLLATLIGDWMATHVRRVSVQDHATAAKKPEA